MQRFLRVDLKRWHLVIRQRTMRLKENLGQPKQGFGHKRQKRKRNLIDSYKSQLSKQKTESENQKQEIATLAKRKLAKQTNRLGKQINIIQEQNQKQLSEIQRNATLEVKVHTRLPKEFSKEKTALIDNLRRDYSEVFNKYEKKLTEMKQQRENLRGVYEEKILDIQARHSDQLKNMREKQRVRRIEEMNNFKEFAAKDASNKDTIGKLEKKFSEKLNQQKLESDRFLKQSLRSAESQMRKLRLEHEES